MKYCFIVNPASGTGKAQGKLKENIESVCRAEGVDFVIHQTEAPGDAERFVRSVCAEGEAVRFYACGGDGTLCDVVNGAAGFAFAEVGVLPVGTGNDFVRNFSPKDKFLDITAQLHGSAERIDLIKYNDRYFVNMLNTGFDCEVVKQVVKIKKNPLIPGKLAYIAGVVKTLVKKPGVKMEVSIDGNKPRALDLLLTCIANGAYCGGGFNSTPHSAVNDGLMDICFINNITRRKFISLVSSYKDGTYLGRQDAPEFAEYVRCKKLEISFPELHSVSVDGELEDYKHIEFTVLPRALRFCVPEGCSMITPPALKQSAATV